MANDIQEGMIKVKIGAYTGDTSPIYEDLKTIKQKINKNPPKIVLGLNKVATAQNIKNDLRNVITDLQKTNFNLSIGNIADSTAKSVKQGITQGLKSYKDTGEIKALNKLYIGDRTKGDPVNGLRNQLLAKGNVAKVSVTGTTSLVKNKEQLTSLSATITETTGKVKTLNFELANIGKRKGFVESDSKRFKVIRDEAYKTSNQIKKLFDESFFESDGKNPIGIKGINFKNTKSLDDEFGENAAALKSQLSNVQNIFNSLGTDKFPNVKEMFADTAFMEKNETGFRNLALAVQNYNEELKKASKTLKQSAKDNETVQNFDKKFAEMSKFGYNNSKFKTNSNYKSQYDSIMTRSNAAIYNKDAVAMRQLSAEFDAFNRRITDAGLLGQSFGDKLGQQLNKLGVYFSAASVMLTTWRGIKSTIDNVIKLDSAVTDLQIATGYTRQETQALLSTYSQMGKQLGATTAQVAEASDAWLRQGYTVEDTNTLIKNSMMLSKLGQIESADATKALTSAMKGYRVEVEDSLGIVDKFASVDMAAAVSAGYLATAMAETATTARLAGISMDELIGYIAQVGSVTQDGAESVGTALKTTFARMGNIKAGKLFDPESEESLSDVETTLSGLGIKLRDNQSEFRDFGDVLDEVGSKWKKFSSVQQNAVAVAFAGYRVA